MRVKYGVYHGETYYDGRAVVRDFHRNGELYVRIKSYDYNSDIYNGLFGVKYFSVCVFVGGKMIAKAVNADLPSAFKFAFLR